MPSTKQIQLPITTPPSRWPHGRQSRYRSCVFFATRTPTESLCVPWICLCGRPSSDRGNRTQLDAFVGFRGERGAPSKPDSFWWSTGADRKRARCAASGRAGFARWLYFFVGVRISRSASFLFLCAEKQIFSLLNSGFCDSNKWESCFFYWCLLRIVECWSVWNWSESRSSTMSRVSNKRRSASHRLLNYFLKKFRWTWILRPSWPQNFSFVPPLCLHSEPRWRPVSNVMNGYRFPGYLSHAIYTYHQQRTNK